MAKTKNLVVMFGWLALSRVTRLMRSNVRPISTIKRYFHFHFYRFSFVFNSFSCFILHIAIVFYR